ncbi:MAG: uracil phosphoribosyltransferase [Verrucomicrobia bacterium]|nr:uracil phosphoribosyltransferase [Kiritimatiellia bacterium]MCB1102539.1 uracil phosphoribosyltransferase [Kiritimatiellia bacterium]MCP5487790.1 uracil phosphoribosyltransferase [Verrucomicrobiota bacterium]
MTENTVVTLQHPLVKHHLASLRDQQTPPRAFRGQIDRLSTLLAYEATKDLALAPATIETPLGETDGRVLSQRIGIVPILRAGLGMINPVLNLIPDAEVWHLGFYRDENTLQPVEYYKKLPPGDPVDVALILDPMLATGGSAVAAIEAVVNWGVTHVKLLAMIAAPEGVEAVQSRFPQTQLYVCEIDVGLNDQGFIIPGLGDAGDRMFNARAV